MNPISVHKGVGYAIHTHNGLDWVWKIYPRPGLGRPICGSTRGTEDDAICDCIDAIELKLRIPRQRQSDGFSLVRLSV